MARWKIGKGHRLEQLRRMPWHYCPRCGLVRLKNDATRRAFARPCEAESE